MHKKHQQESRPRPSSSLVTRAHHHDHDGHAAAHAADDEILESNDTDAIRLLSEQLAEKLHQMHFYPFGELVARAATPTTTPPTTPATIMPTAEQLHASCRGAAVPAIYRFLVHHMAPRSHVQHVQANLFLNGFYDDDDDNDDNDDEDDDDDTDTDTRTGVSHDHARSLARKHPELTAQLDVERRHVASLRAEVLALSRAAQTDSGRITTLRQTLEALQSKNEVIALSIRRQEMLIALIRQYKLQLEEQFAKARASRGVQPSQASLASRASAASHEERIDVAPVRRACAQLRDMIVPLLDTDNIGDPARRAPRSVDAKPSGTMMFRPRASMFESVLPPQFGVTQLATALDRLTREDLDRVEALSSSSSAMKTTASITAPTPLPTTTTTTAAADDSSSRTLCRHIASVQTSHVDSFLATQSIMAESQALDAETHTMLDKLRREESLEPHSNSLRELVQLRTQAASARACAAHMSHLVAHSEDQSGSSARDLLLRQLGQHERTLERAQNARDAAQLRVHRRLQALRRATRRFARTRRTLDEVWRSDVRTAAERLHRMCSSLKHRYVAEVHAATSSLSLFRPLQNANASGLAASDIRSILRSEQVMRRRLAGWPLYRSDDHLLHHLMRIHLRAITCFSNARFVEQSVARLIHDHTSCVNVLSPNAFESLVSSVRELARVQRTEWASSLAEGESRVQRIRELCDALAAIGREQEPFVAAMRSLSSRSTESISPRTILHLVEHFFPRPRSHSSTAASTATRDIGFTVTDRTSPTATADTAVVSLFEWLHRRQSSS